MPRLRTRAPTSSPVRTHRQGATSSNGGSSNGKETEQWLLDFTMLWLDVLEKHGQAALVADRLAAQVRASCAGATSSSNDNSSYWQQQRNALTDTASLHESMQSVSELLSSVEEIIRKRLFDDAPSSPCACAKGNTNGSTLTTAAPAKPNALDTYLDGVPLPSPDRSSDHAPVFANVMRAWGSSRVAERPRYVGIELHDAMMRNNLRLAGFHDGHAFRYPITSNGHNGNDYGVDMGSDYGASPLLHYAPSAGASMTGSAHLHSTLSDIASNNKHGGWKKRKASAVSSDADGSATKQQTTQSQQPHKQLDTRKAEKVLAVRNQRQNQVGEYLVQWHGVVEPSWVTRRLAPEQAKRAIDRYNAVARQVARKQQLATTTHETKRSDNHAAATAAATTATLPDEGIFVVDKIVGHRTRCGRKQYLVKWDGYDSSDNTWEAAAKLQADVADVVEAYERKLLAKKQQQSPHGASASASTALDDALSHVVRAVSDADDVLISADSSAGAVLQVPPEHTSETVNQQQQQQQLETVVVDDLVTAYPNALGVGSSGTCVDTCGGDKSAVDNVTAAAVATSMPLDEAPLGPAVVDYVSSSSHHLACANSIE